MMSFWKAVREFKLEFELRVYEVGNADNLSIVKQNMLYIPLLITLSG